MAVLVRPWSECDDVIIEFIEYDVIFLVYREYMVNLKVICA